MKKRAILLLLTFLLVGCRVELYSNLSEQDANQMLALLLSNQIPAEKAQSKDGTLQLRVDEDQFVNAVETLRQHGYPKKKFVSAEDFFPAGQLISSPVQEKTRINYLKEQALERMLSNIEGVIAANVAIGQEVVESGFNELTKPSAAVLVKYSPEVNLKAFTVQIRNLVLNAIPGMIDEDVALMLQPASQRTMPVDPALLQPEDNTEITASVPAGNQRWRWIAGGGGIGMLLIATVLIWLRRRRKRHGNESDSAE
jgi:type III secretion protein J